MPSFLAGAHRELSAALIKCQGSVYRGCADLLARAAGRHGIDVVTHKPEHTSRVAKRRSSWACIGNPKPEQETSKGTHAQETSAYQRRPTSQHAAQGSNPPIRALYMQLARYHTHIKPHRLPPVPQAQNSTAPTMGAAGTIPAHTQLKTRRRGNSPAPKNTV